MSTDDLENYFRVTSSPSQAKNAARFFREVCTLAGIDLDTAPQTRARSSPDTLEQPAELEEPAGGEAGPRSFDSSNLLAAKARLLEKLPACRDEWTAAEYEAICRQFVAMLGSLDAPSTD
jgi:hypothetical protein